MHLRFPFIQESVDRVEDCRRLNRADWHEESSRLRCDEFDDVDVTAVWLYIQIPETLVAIIGLFAIAYEVMIDWLTLFALAQVQESCSLRLRFSSVHSVTYSNNSDPIIRLCLCKQMLLL